MIHHRGAYLNAIGEVLETGMTFESTYLWTLPMFHCNGWCFTWGVTAMGGTHLCLRRVEPGRIWDLIDGEGVTHYCGAPTVQIGIVNDPKAHALTRAGDVRGGRRAALADAARRVSRSSASARSTCTASPRPTARTPSARGTRDGIACRPTRWRSKAARQGQGYVIADLVRVVDEHMQDVAMDGETLGEVIMRGNNVMKGYFEQPEASAEAFRGGWFHSGDLAVWHPDGYIELRDRKKDIIISGGENISTIEVEQTVAKHPAVMECAVVAVPDDEVGRAAQGVRDAQAGADAPPRGRSSSSAASTSRTSSARLDRVRRPAQDVDRQGPEIRAA